jgi:glycosyltransferase involved in cell wall biosynthesis
MTTSTWPIVVYSHLRWDFVFQRPQQILSRLAAHRRVFFVEEPMAGDGALRLDVSFPAPNVLRCVPKGAVDGHPFGGAQTPALAAELARMLRSTGEPRHVAWLYTPMAWPLAELLAPSTVVYDCMDELSAFDGAPPELAEHERALFGAAHLVFTGGRSLYRAKRDHHHAVHCFPSSVDVPHFEQARTDRVPDPKHARLGFYGVLDERLDRALLAAVAAARPHWRIDMVGPVVKIDPATLPRAENIHYAGQRPYEALPAHVAEWDVCLMPFAINAATRFISPTKVLEYMAAERPIVSTPITDVAEPYGDVVRIASTPEEFIAACDAALAETPDERRERAARMRAIVAGTSWHRTVREMAALIDEVTEDKGEHPWQPMTRSSSALARPA